MGKEKKQVEQAIIQITGSAEKERERGKGKRADAHAVIGDHHGDLHEGIRRHLMLHDEAFAVVRELEHTRLVLCGQRASTHSTAGSFLVSS